MNTTLKPAVKRDPKLGAWVALVDVKQTNLFSNYEPRDFGTGHRYGYGLFGHDLAMRVALRAAKGESR